LLKVLGVVYMFKELLFRMVLVCPPPYLECG